MRCILRGCPARPAACCRTWSRGSRRLRRTCCSRAAGDGQGQGPVRSNVWNSPGLGACGCIQNSGGGGIWDPRWGSGRHRGGMRSACTAAAAAVLLTVQMTSSPFFMTVAWMATKGVGWPLDQLPAGREQAGGGEPEGSAESRRWQPRESNGLTCTRKTALPGRCCSPLPPAG